MNTTEPPLPKASARAEIRAGCDHLGVSIKRIITALSARGRTIGGTCLACSREVTRIQTPNELRTGAVTTKWA